MGYEAIRSRTLREALDAAGWSQNALAKHLGVDKAVISRHVNGMAVPKQRQEEIAAALGCAVSDISWPRPTEAAA